MNGSTKCNECFESPSALSCTECEQVLCHSCDELIHRCGRRKIHNRQYLCNACKSKTTHHCESCLQYICSSCLSFHTFHKTFKISAKKQVAIIWDINSQGIISAEDIVQTLSCLRDLYTAFDIFKVYGDSFLKWQDLFSYTLVTNVVPVSISNSDAIIIDLPFILQNNLTEVLIISSKLPKYKEHLKQIQSSLPKTLIFISTAFPNLEKICVEDIPSHAHSSTHVILKSLSIDLAYRPQGNFPYHQSFNRKPTQSLSHDYFLTYLKELADSGLIMHDSSWLCKSFAQKSRVSILQSTTTIKELESFGHIHTVEREFCDVKIMSFTGLKIDSLTVESVIWALRSLKQDEMLPAERSIQSRIKEAFDYKVSASEWSSFKDYLKSTKHWKSFDGLNEDSPFMSQNLGFEVKESIDPVNKQKIQVISLKNEDWQSVDQYIKEGDVLNVKSTNEWDEFCRFFQDYFSVPDPTLRGISGGRYGCAQFVKYCGNDKLKKCSLGRLSYMVQLSIDEDLMRYQKTLLVWIQGETKNISLGRIREVQEVIIKLLNENKKGINLAQLPNYIKKKVGSSFNINDLGFAKLKDLVMAIPEIEIEQRGFNMPFVIIKNNKKSEDKIKKMTQISQNFNPGLNENIESKKSTH